MVRPLLLTAVGAFVVGGWRQRVMRPAHVACRRRLFSFWDRHGGYNLLWSAIRKSVADSDSVFGVFRQIARQNKELEQNPDPLIVVLLRTAGSFRKNLLAADKARRRR